jgi:hypothetical protein
MKTLEEMADEHWKWIEGLFETRNKGDKITIVEIPTAAYLYKTAFTHGYKHGKKHKGDK